MSAHAWSFRVITLIRKSVNRYTEIFRIEYFERFFAAPESFSSEMARH